MRLLDFNLANKEKLRHRKINVVIVGLLTQVSCCNLNEAVKAKNTHTQYLSPQCECSLCHVLGLNVWKYFKKVR